MDNDLTAIAVVLDRSGSMSSTRADTIGGFNTFLDAQKALPGRATITLAQFDHEYDLLLDAVPLADCPPLSTSSYVPRGGTALLDAIGRTIDAMGAKLAATPEAQRPARVVFVTLTDGHENQSKEYDRAAIKAMVDRQRDVYGWKFVFLGADLASVTDAMSLGFDASASQTYKSTSAGTRGIWSTTSNSIGSYRGGGGYVATRMVIGGGKVVT